MPPDTGEKEREEKIAEVMHDVSNIIYLGYK